MAVESLVSSQGVRVSGQVPLSVPLEVAAESLSSSSSQGFRGSGWYSVKGSLGVVGCHKALTTSFDGTQ